MTAATLSLGESHAPEWAGRARNTGGSRRLVNNRHRASLARHGASPVKSRRLALIPRPGVKQGASLVGVPQGGGVRSLPAPFGVGGRLGGIDRRQGYWGFTMTDKRIFVMAHDEARRRAVAAVVEAPADWRVTVEPPKRNLEQNAALHARISEIAARMEWCGKKWDLETWKRLLVGAWTRAINEPVMMLPALDGHGVEIVFRKTSTLTKRECSDLLEFVNAWAAENVPDEVAA